MSASRRSIRIGIVGAESTHAVAFARIFRRMPGFRVVAIWGETPALARKAAREASIPRVVQDPREMLGQVDALLVVHRHPDPHVPAARPFVRRGVPVYIGKPFCRRPAEGRPFLGAVDSFGSVPLQRSFLSFQKGLPRLGRILAGSVSGPCDLDSPYAGIWFYGIHLVEMALAAFGPHIVRTEARRTPSGALGVLHYRNGSVVALHFLKEGKAFSMAAAGTRGSLHREIRFDRSPYLSSARRIARLFRTGKGPRDILKPVEVLSTIEKGLKRSRARG